MGRMYEVMTSEQYHHSPYGDVPHRAVWETFKANTTAHGIPHVNNARGPLKTTIWLLLSLTSLGGFCYNLYLLGDKFFSYPYKVSVEMKHKTNMTFPAVSVCNNNPVLESLVYCSDTLSKILGYNGSCPSHMDPSKVIGPPGANGPSTTVSPSGPGLLPVGQNPTASAAPGPAGLNGGALSTPTPSGPPGELGTTPAPAPGPSGLTSAAALTPTPGPPGPTFSPIGPTVTTGGLSGPTPPSGTPGPSSRKKRQVAPDGGDGGWDGGSTQQKGTFDGSKMDSAGRYQRQNFGTFLKIRSALANMEDSEKEALGYAVDDLIIDCEYKGSTCNASTDFTHFYNSKYGNCYTFNSGWDENIALEHSFRPGPLYGLSLTFNVNQTEYIGSLAESAGITIVVHPQEKMPFPEDEGLAISPGMHSFVGVNMLEITRISHPWGNCTTINEYNFTRNVYEELHGINYSTNACYKTCYQKEVILKCKCADSRFPLKGEAFGNLNHTSCDPDNTTDETCMNGVEDRYAQGLLNCDDSCPEPCSERSFSTTISTQLWPSLKYEGTLLSGLRQTNAGLRIYTSDHQLKEYLETNLGKVTIYLQEFNYESIEQSELYNAFSFVSDIGGILGLYIGFSLLSIMEFFELGIDLIVVSVLSCCRRKKSNRGAPSARAQVSPSSEDLYNDKNGTPPPAYPYYKSPTPKGKRF